MMRWFRFALAGALALAWAAGAPAQEIRLSDVAKEAAKPDSAQEVVGQAELSDTKQKADQPSPQVPVRDSGSTDAGGSGALDWGSAGLGGGTPIASGPSYGLPAPAPGPAPPEAQLRIGTVGGFGGLDGASIEGVGSAGLLLGFAVGPWNVDARGWYQRAGLEAALDRSFRGFDGLAWDVVLRRRVTPDRARWPVHVLLTGRLGRYAWDYRNVVQVAEGSSVRMVEDDRVAFRAVLAGAGIDLARGHGLTLGATLAAGLQDFDDRTREGFRNDLFERGTVFEVLAEVVYQPPW